MHEEAKTTILCFGEALIDFLERPGESPELPKAFLQYAGGAPANVAVAVARLGGDAQFVGMLGNDMFGDFLLGSLRDAGVGTDGVVRTDESKTALAFVALDNEGERSFSFYRPPAADLLFRERHFQAELFEKASSYHVCSNSITEAAIAEATLAGAARARASGALVSVDLNLRPALWPHGVDPNPGLWELLCSADLVKLARNEFAYLAESGGGEEAVLGRLLSSNVRLVVVTDGAANMQSFSREREGHTRGFRVRAVDTTAAGDAFVGGMLFRLAQLGIDGRGFESFSRDDAAIDDVVTFAAAVGALAVTRHGAFAAMPTITEVHHLLQEQNENA